MFKLLNKAWSDGVGFGHLWQALLLVIDNCEQPEKEKETCSQV